MRAELLDAVTTRGVLTRREALSVVAEHVLDDALCEGLLVRVFPGVYALPGSEGDLEIRRRAALAHRRSGALSHTDALDVWRLPSAPSDAVHITVPGSEPATRSPGLRLHRRRDFAPTAPFAVVRNGMRVVRLEQAVVESWNLLPTLDQRVPAIVALRERRTTGERLGAVLDEQPRVAGAAEMRRVFALGAGGCHSPLEMWGHEHVFTDPRLPLSRCQVPVELTSGRIYLDRLFEEELVNAELDGAAYHGEPGQRERDLRRDAALAALGYLTVRFSHPRLHGDPDGVIAELLRILAIRRAQLGISVA